MKKYLFSSIVIFFSFYISAQENKYITKNKIYFWGSTKNFTPMLGNKNYFSNSNTEFDLSVCIHNYGLTFNSLSTSINLNASNTIVDSKLLYFFYRYNLNKFHLLPKFGIGSVSYRYIDFFSSFYPETNILTCIGLGVDTQYSLLSWLSISGGFNVFSAKNNIFKGFSFGLQIGRLRNKA